MNHNIKVSLDLAKIDKARAKAGKNGALYFDLILWANDAPDKFGNDFSVKPAYSKAELDLNPRPRLPFIGNAKIMGGTKPAAPAPVTEEVPF